MLLRDEFSIAVRPDLVSSYTEVFYAALSPEGSRNPTVLIWSLPTPASLSPVFPWSYEACSCYPREL